ncbi:DNA polymerase III subunit epsilon [Acidihalobacter prosperus]
MRHIVLDTETTGLEAELGHRVIEIGCVEILNRHVTDRRLHYYLQPDREIDEGAAAVHGITNAFLADKPRFEDIVDDFLEFVREGELVIHNASFDIGFINAELARIDGLDIHLEDLCPVVDTLMMARKMHPGQRNSLDALCKRYGVSNEHRELHGALLDAQLLSEVYLAMTGGQSSLLPESDPSNIGQEILNTKRVLRQIDSDRIPLPIIRADDAELASHESLLETISQASEEGCLWRQ